jgi:anti-anti-sigma factor
MLKQRDTEVFISSWNQQIPVIPETNLELFKFYFRNNIHTGMRYQDVLYGLVCEFKSLCEESILSLFEKNHYSKAEPKSFVISQSSEGSKVWVRLQCLSHDPVNYSVFTPRSLVFSASVLHDASKWLEKSLADGNRLLVLDCHQVRLIESTGLAVLVTLQRLARMADATLALCAISNQFRMVLEMTNTLSLFSIYSSQDELQQAVSISDHPLFKAQ